ncbi:hypothetical protein ACNF40_00970 [Cuniculiplasma sp. SKW4]|uniref:hypothetical protein n=1 Tax=Cuniculiplasma sp. SKW4 TaxID=3400171 RepID=UPI003FD63653
MRYTSRQYIGKNVDVEKLKDLVVLFFEDEGFVVQESKVGSIRIVEARKGGILKTLLSTDKCIKVIIKGEPNDVEVTMGVGKWIPADQDDGKKDGSVAASKVFVEVPESLWAYEIEHHLWVNIETNVEMGF